MFELASLMGIASTLKRTAFIQPTQQAKNGILVLNRHFRNFPLKPNLGDDFMETETLDFQTDCCTYYKRKLESPEILKNPHNLTLGGEYFVAVQYFYEILDRVKAEFQFYEGDLERAAAIASSFEKHSAEDDDNLLACIHTRRGYYSSDVRTTERRLKAAVRFLRNGTGTIENMLENDNPQFRILLNCC